MIDVLKARGAEQVLNARTSKYTVFKHPSRPDYFLYIGKAGALRVGPTVAASIPAEKTKARLLQDSSPS